MAKNVANKQSSSSNSNMEISTRRINDIQVPVGPEDFGNEGGGSSGGGSGGGSSSTYPTDCDGLVITTTVATSIPCGCGHSWEQLLNNTCTGCNMGYPTWPSLETNLVYECVPSSGGGHTSGGGTNTGGGGSSAPPNNGGNGSITTPVNPDGTSAVPDILTNHLSLSPAQTDLLIQQPDLANDIFEFLQENNSDETKEFAKEAIIAKENIGDIDLENRLIYNPLIAQDYQTSMSASEITIFNTLNPLQKEGYLRAATQAYIYAETHFPKPVRNTKGDTFKHTYWNALSTVYIGESLTEQLTTAHEAIDYNPNYANQFKETQMDLFNNSKGRQIAYGSGKLYQLVQNALHNGELRYLSNLEFIGGFWRATDNSNLIPTNQ